MPGMGLNLHERPPLNLQGSTWGGLGWAFNDEDAEQIREAAREVLAQVSSLPQGPDRQHSRESRAVALAESGQLD